LMSAKCHQRTYRNHRRAPQSGSIGRIAALDFSSEQVSRAS
jgi:hypothetical protein